MRNRNRTGSEQVNLDSIQFDSIWFNSICLDQLVGFSLGCPLVALLGRWVETPNKSRFASNTNIHHRQQFEWPFELVDEFKVSFGSIWFVVFALLQVSLRFGFLFLFPLPLPFPFRFPFLSSTRRDTTPNTTQHNRTRFGSMMDPFERQPNQNPSICILAQALWPAKQMDPNVGMIF